MSISERLYIRWLPDEASEPTSTLVLTAPNRQFVDLRLVQPADPSAAFSTLDWGISGRSVGTPEHGVWVHEISSRTTQPEGEKDEGDMAPHPTLPDVMLERGTMLHPESGTLREYEEAWKEVRVLPIPAGRGSHGGRVSVFLEMGPDAAGRRGMVCRVGQFCQGIVRDDAKVTVERWAWSEGGGWKRVARVGDAPMVCETTWGSKDLKEGDTVSNRGSEWTVKVVRVW